MYRWRFSGRKETATRVSSIAVCRVARSVANALPTMIATATTRSTSPNPCSQPIVMPCYLASPPSPICGPRSAGTIGRVSACEPRAAAHWP
jgi:hypothetical protein